MKNNVLLITGASSDIGIELINNINENYNIIIAHYNKNDEKLKSLKNKLGDKLKIIQCNFLNENDIINFIDEIKSLNYEVNNIVHLSSIRFSYKNFKKTVWKDYDKNIKSQLMSIYYICNSFIPTMAKNKFGKIVFVLSSCTVNQPPKYISDYVTAKYAVMGFMKSIAAEYADKNITINAVSPSMIETKFLENIPEIAVKQTAESNPHKRNVYINDIIPSIKFLLSSDSNFITGQNIVISGGSTI